MKTRFGRPLILLALVLAASGLVSSMPDAKSEPYGLAEVGTIQPMSAPPPPSVLLDNDRPECVRDSAASGISEAGTLIRNMGFGAISGLAASSLITLAVGPLALVSSLWWPMLGATGGYLMLDDQAGNGADGCQADSSFSGGVDVRRSWFLLVPQSTAENSATLQYQQTKSAAQQQGRLNTDPEQLARLQTIVRRLVVHADRFNPDASHWAWEINLLEAPIANAYCMPGGKIMVYSGIIQQLKLTDDELAAVIGHEISHALLEHGRARMSEQLVKQLGIAALTLKFQLGHLSAVALSRASELAVSLPYSRKHETDADLAGIELAARAGYDPRAAIRVWQKMSAASQGQPPQWLSTHPGNATRIQDIETNLPKVLPFYTPARKMPTSQDTWH